MKKDISALLREWQYQPGQITARFVPGADGDQRIQVRLDLGLLQMHADGRPDGEHPFGYGSLLEFFEAKLDGEVREAPDPTEEGDAQAGKPENASSESPASVRGGEQPESRAQEEPPFVLTPEECSALREEAAQYYQRYIACLRLEDFDRVVRDTTRNLRVLDLCAKHAQSPQDKTVLEQFRAYIVMVRARALASHAVRDNENKAAVFAIDEALDTLKRASIEGGRPQQFEKSEEVRALREMRQMLTPKLPVSQKAELKARLQRAIEQENYELAAILRDELKQLKGE
jgi:hypothetical protein